VLLTRTHQNKKTERRRTGIPEQKNGNAKKPKNLPLQAEPKKYIRREKRGRALIIHKSKEDCPGEKSRCTPKKASGREMKLTTAPRTADITNTETTKRVRMARTVKKTNRLEIG